MTSRQEQPEDRPESRDHEDRSPEGGQSHEASRPSGVSLPAWARSRDAESREDDRRFGLSVPSWARPAGANGPEARPGGRRTSLRRRLIWTVIVLLVLFAVWSNYPFISNPWVALFRQPSGEASSISSAQRWAMYGAGPQGGNYIAEAKGPEGVIAYSVEVDGEVRSAPVISGGNVYIGGQSRIAAFAANTGDLLWEKKVNGPAHGTPAVTDGPSSLVYLGLLGTNILALDPATGETVWEYDGDSPFPGTVTVNDGIVYAPSRGGSVEALDADTGKRLWKVDAGDPVVAPVAVHDGKMFAASTGGVLYIRNAGTGDKRARIRTGGAIVSPPVVSGERMYLLFEGDLLAFNNTIRETPGRYPAELVWAQMWIWGFPLPSPPEHAGLQWRISPGGCAGDFANPPSVTPDALYLGTDDGCVLALDPEDGSELWQNSPPGGTQRSGATRMAGVSSPIVVAGDMLLVAHDDGTLRAVNRFTQEEAWTVSLGSPLVAPMGYANGTVYAHTQDGNLHAIR